MIVKAWKSLTDIHLHFWTHDEHWGSSSEWLDEYFSAIVWIYEPLASAGPWSSSLQQSQLLLFGREPCFAKSCLGRGVLQHPHSDTVLMCLGCLDALAHLHLLNPLTSVWCGSGIIRFSLLTVSQEYGKLLYCHGQTLCTHSNSSNIFDHLQSVFHKYGELRIDTLITISYLLWWLTSDNNLLILNCTVSSTIFL